MRLDKLLTLLGEGTRSEIKAAVRAGRVTVNGASARDAGMQVEGETDDIRLDGRRLSYKPVRHVMLHKPAGVLTAARDKRQEAENRHGSASADVYRDGRNARGTAG